MTTSEYMAGMQRDDAALGNEELIRVYERGVDELAGAVEGMTTEELSARPVHGRMSTVEVVAHIADSEIFMTDRVVRTLAMDRPLLMSAEEELYFRRIPYRDLDVAEELALFSALRRHLARILRTQPAEAWERTAVHSESGLVTVRQLVFQAIRHTRHHLPFIAEKREALRARSS